MPSSSQKEASRLNGSKSHGPVTAAGKARSSQNALRHGFLCKLVCTGSESEQGLTDIVTEHLLRFGDIDGVEFGMIEEMCVAHWRMRRAWSIEKEWMDQFIETHSNLSGVTQVAAAFAELADTNKFKLLQ